MRRLLAIGAMLAVVGCSAPASSAVGIVTQVEGEGLGQVRAFTLRTATGDSIRFEVGAVALGDGMFPPDHLREHMAAAEAIVVAYRTEDGRLIATSLTDAPTVSP